MKICLIGDFSGSPDEGMKNISRTIYEHLYTNHDVLVCSGKNIVNPSVLYKVISFNPDIIHYLHGPTVRSLLLMKILKAIKGWRTKTVVSATRPYFSSLSSKLVRFLKPDLIFTQSEKFENFFSSRRCKTVFLPNGVDCRKFSPVDPGIKQELQKKFGLPDKRKIVLHVGHIKENRNLQLFFEIQKTPGIQVVIVGGTGEKTDEKLKEQLINAGIIVIHRYIRDISEIYKAADLYVFQIKDSKEKFPKKYNEVGAIDLPLSVLEAMACNLPVVTTRFGALPRLFNSGNGFEYAKSEHELIDKSIRQIHSSSLGTRSKVLPFDWQRIIGDLESWYVMLLADKKEHNESL